MAARPQVLVLSGHGRYEDQWHDMPATSHLAATTLAGADLDVRVVGTWPRTLADLGAVDLLVVNAGPGLADMPVADDAWQPGWDGLREYLASGRPVLGLHTACNTFHDVPEWLDRLGLAWVERSMHPPIGTATVSFTSSPAAAGHPIVPAAGSSFELWDERYSLLQQRADDLVVLATHDLDGVPQPLVAVRDNAAGRSVYDALGHGLESYASPERRALLRREADWALGRL